MTGAPSTKTSYVVVGEGAGPKKLEMIKKLNGVQMLDEDGLLDLIRTSDGRAMDDKQLAAQEKAQKKILDQAKEMEKQEKEEESARKRKEKALEGTGIAAKWDHPLCPFVGTDGQERSTCLRTAVDDQVRAEEHQRYLWEQSAR